MFDLIPHPAVSLAKTARLRARGRSCLKGLWVQDGSIRTVTCFLFVPGCHLLSHYSLPSVCVRMCKCVSLTQPTAVAWHCHEGAQGATDDAVGPAEWGLLEGAGVLVQEGVHAMGGGGAAVPHEGLWNTTTQRLSSFLVFGNSTEGLAVVSQASEIKTRHGDKENQLPSSSTPCGAFFIWNACCASQALCKPTEFIWHLSQGLNISKNTKHQDKLWRNVCK